MAVRRTLYLYYRLITQQLKAILEYQTDFLILLVSAVITQLLGIVFLRVIFDRIPDINGWGFWEVAFMYAMIYVTEGIGSLLFEGTWRLGGLINRGELDMLLLRPVSPILQVLASGVGVNGIGNLVTGSIIIGQALVHMDIEWKWDKICITVIVLLSAAVVRIAINLASNCANFWIRNAGNAFSLMVLNVGDFAKYPITIYPSFVRVLVAGVVPFAFVSFFPVAAINGANGLAWVWMLCPVVAILCAGASVAIFRIGLRTYESAGN
ncbi:MAG: ABC-2 family transporter protein [Cohnella sp.]|nr:ABC-2 family transporter protein [Cohnella sp.]